MPTYNLRTLQASNVEKSTIAVKKEQRAVMAASAKQYTEAEKNAYSLDAMHIGATCEAFQQAAIQKITTL